MTSGENCHHFDSNAVDSCYFLTSELNINGTCFTISNLTHNYFHCRFSNTGFLLFPLFNILEGLLYFLVFMTALEFICAQAPLRLKGLLIGVWYALLAINYLLVQVPEQFTVTGNSWIIFHEVKAFFVFLSLVMYLCVSKHYCYRQRDEVMNEQFLVEEIFDREHDLAEQLERAADKKLEKPLLITSVNECRLFGAAN